MCYSVNSGSALHSAGFISPKTKKTYLTLLFATRKLCPCGRIWRLVTGFGEYCRGLFRRVGSIVTTDVFGLVVFPSWSCFVGTLVGSSFDFCKFLLVLLGGSPVPFLGPAHQGLTFFFFALRLYFSFFSLPWRIGVSLELCLLMSPALCSLIVVRMWLKLFLTSIMRFLGPPPFRSFLGGVARITFRRRSRNKIFCGMIKFRLMVPPVRSLRIGALFGCKFTITRRKLLTVLLKSSLCLMVRSN